MMLLRKMFLIQFFHIFVSENRMGNFSIECLILFNTLKNKLEFIEAMIKVELRNRFLFATIGISVSRGCVS